MIVSDLHCGCRLGLCPPEAQPLMDGGFYEPSAFQKKVWGWWEEFWHEFVPEATQGEPYAVAVNGEAVDGVHHRATSQVSHNLEDQKGIAMRVLASVRDSAEGRFYMLSGTPAHSGESGCDDEAVARELGAIPESLGDAKRYARYLMWVRVGDALVNITHHIGTTGSQAYEATAIHKELVEAFVESGRWHNEHPDFVVRGHRHRFAFSGLHTAKGRAVSICSAGWQGKTPFAYKIPGGRQAEPQFGGIVIRQAKGGEFYFREFVKSFARPEEVIL